MMSAKFLIADCKKKENINETIYLKIAKKKKTLMKQFILNWYAMRAP